MRDTVLVRLLPVLFNNRIFGYNLSLDSLQGILHSLDTIPRFHDTPKVNFWGELYTHERKTYFSVTIKIGFVLLLPSLFNEHAHRLKKKRS
jgi:hypothetical protein